MYIKDIREHAETYLFKDIAMGNCFEYDGAFFIRGYQVFFGEEKKENIGLATNIETGEIMRCDFEVEVIPIICKGTIE